MKKPYFSMIGAVICGAILFQFIMSLFIDDPYASSSVTKWDGIINIWFFVYVTPVVVVFLVFMWRIRRFYKNKGRTRKENNL
jgi:heme/copper-type cytochrome/quinol oxidase subunit 2